MTMSKLAGRPVRRVLGVLVATLLCSGAARATAPIRPEFVVIEVDYKGLQEKPVWPLCIGNSIASVNWCEGAYLHARGEDFWLTKKRVTQSANVSRLVDDVPSLQSKTFYGSDTGREIDIAVVERGRVRHVLLRGDMSEALLRKFIKDSGGDAELRNDLREFKWSVDRYAREYLSLRSARSSARR